MNEIKHHQCREHLGYQEQRQVLPPYPQRMDIARQFHDLVRDILKFSLIQVIESEYRAKTDERIALKVARRQVANREWAVCDLYGVRCLLGTANEVYLAASAVASSFPPEDRFHLRLPTILDYNNPEVARNRFSNPSYRAVHVLVPFGNLDVPHLGEIQLMTPEQKVINDQTRAEYERRRTLGVESSLIQPD